MLLHDGGIRRMCEHLSAHVHKIKKARKQHKCYECLGTIKKGECYHYHSGVLARHPVFYHVCSDCQILHKKINSTIRSTDDKLRFGGLFVASCEACGGKFLDEMVKIMERRGVEIIPNWSCDREKNLRKRGAML
jgi:hypothetical protein